MFAALSTRVAKDEWRGTSYKPLQAATFGVMALMLERGYDLLNSRPWVYSLV